MTFELKTAATERPLTLDETKNHLRIVHTDDDALILALIDEATGYVENYIQRQLVTATWYLYLDEFPDEICLRKPPIGSVVAITYTDLDGDSQSLSASTYQADLAGDDKPGRIKPVDGQSWPSTQGNTYNAVRVEFTAGYGDATQVPRTARDAMLLHVELSYDRPDKRRAETLERARDALLNGPTNWGFYA